MAYINNAISYISSLTNKQIHVDYDELGDCDNICDAIFGIIDQNPEIRSDLMSKSILDDDENISCVGCIDCYHCIECVRCTECRSCMKLHHGSLEYEYIH